MLNVGFYLIENVFCITIGFSGSSSVSEKISLICHFLPLFEFTLHKLPVLICCSFGIIPKFLQEFYHLWTESYLNLHLAILLININSTSQCILQQLTHSSIMYSDFLIEYFFNSLQEFVSCSEE